MCFLEKFRFLCLSMSVSFASCTNEAFWINCTPKCSEAWLESWVLLQMPILFFFNTNKIFLIRFTPKASRSFCKCQILFDLLEHHTFQINFGSKCSQGSFKENCPNLEERWRYFYKWQFYLLSRKIRLSNKKSLSKKFQTLLGVGVDCPLIIKNSLRLKGIYSPSLIKMGQLGWESIGNEQVNIQIKEL